MRRSLARLIELARSPEGLKVIKYSMVSVISALTSLAVLTFVYGVLRLWTEAWSVLFSNVVAGVPSYILNRRWVWGKSGRSHIWREIVPFWVMSLTGIGFAFITANWAHDFADSHHLDHLARTVLVVGTNALSFGILWLLKFMILNRIFAQIADAELGSEEDAELGSEEAAATRMEQAEV